MNSFIFNNYGFYPETYTKFDNYYLLKYNNCDYYLYLVESIDKVFFQYTITNNYSCFNTFFLNKYGSIITTINKNNYVLIKSNNKKFDKLFNISYYGELIPCMWKKVWIERSEYINYNYPMLKGKDALLDESIDYYLGLLELSISLLDGYEISTYPAYLSHIVFNSNDYYNPLNIKLDIKERDFGEYLKYLFFTDNYKMEELVSIIEDYKNYYNYQLVLARVLYPNYYFDLFDKILKEECDSSILKNIISKIGEFREFYHFLEVEFSKYCKIKKVLL